jgi:flagella basal body P-ring formation protein FlgA
MTLGDTRFHRTSRATLVGILTFVAGALTVRAADWQPPESIREAAREAARQTGATDVEAVAVDDRLKLPACGAALTTGIQRVIQRGQGTVAVTCAGPTPWRLFVPVRVVEQVSVLVLRRNVQAGEVLTEADLEARQQSAAALPFDYLSKPEQAIGQSVRRSQPAGSVLLSATLEQPVGVERGALVTLVAANGSVTVKAAGVALEPARLKDHVRVRSASGRIVEGLVEAPGRVRVGF